MNFTIIRLPAVLASNGHARSSHYRLVALGLWTKPVKLGLRSVGWPVSEVAALNAARIAGRSDDEIRALVVRLEAERALCGGMEGSP